MHTLPLNWMFVKKTNLSSLPLRWSVVFYILCIFFQRILSRWHLCIKNLNNCLLHFFYSYVYRTALHHTCIKLHHECNEYHLFCASFRANAAIQICLILRTVFIPPTNKAPAWVLYNYEIINVVQDSGRMPWQPTSPKSCQRRWNRKWKMRPRSPWERKSLMKTFSMSPISVTRYGIE